MMSVLTTVTDCSPQSYLSVKIDPIFVPLMRILIQKRPDNTVAFAAKFISDNFIAGEPPCDPLPPPTDAIVSAPRLPRPIPPGAAAGDIRIIQYLNSQVDPIFQPLTKRLRVEVRSCKLATVVAILIACIRVLSCDLARVCFCSNHKTRPLSASATCSASSDVVVKHEKESR